MASIDVTESNNALDVTEKKESTLEVAEFATAKAAIKQAIGDAKGDLVGFSGPDAPVRVPKASADGKHLESAAASQGGMKWADHDKAAHDALGIDAETVDGKNPGSASGLATLDAGSKLVEEITDSSHGNRGGGALHADVAPAGADGFMTGADKTKLDGVESGAKDDQSAAEILTAIKTVDGTGSGLDADLVDGLEGHAGTKAAHDALNIDADTVDGAHAAAFTEFGVDDDFTATANLGNKDSVVALDEMAEFKVPHGATCEEIELHELEGTSGSVSIAIHKRNAGVSGWTLVRTVTLAAQSVNRLTGLSDAYIKYASIRARVSVAGVTVKRVAVGFHFRRT